MIYLPKSTDFDSSILGAQLNKLIKPYVKTKIMGPIFYSTIARSLEQQTLLLETEHNHLRGFLQWNEYKKESTWLLNKMAIGSEFQHLGLGHQLMQYFITLAISAERDLRLRVARINDSAIKFYQQYGFEMEPVKIENPITWTMFKKVRA